MSERRGRARHDAADDRYAGRASIFDRLGGREGEGEDRDEREAPARKPRREANEEREEVGPIKSVEGWIVFVRGLNEETTEEDLLDKFAKYGPVKNVQMPLDRRSGYVKGYALIEYDKRTQAEKAIADMDGSKFLDRAISVAWAFAVEK